MFSNNRYNSAEVLENLTADPKAFTSGRRNDDMVNFMCACWELGYDPELKFDKLMPGKWDSYVKEHYERIAPYKHAWVGKYMSKMIEVPGITVKSNQ